MRGALEQEDAWIRSLAGIVPTLDRDGPRDFDVDALLMCSLIDGQTTLQELSEFLATPLPTLVSRLRPLVERGIVHCPALQKPHSSVRHARPSLRPTTPAPPNADALAICRGACERRTIAEGDNPWVS